MNFKYLDVKRDEMIALDLKKNKFLNLTFQFL